MAPLSRNGKIVLGAVVAAAAAGFGYLALSPESPALASKPKPAGAPGARFERALAATVNSWADAHPPSKTVRVADREGREYQLRLWKTEADVALTGPGQYLYWRLERAGKGATAGWGSLRVGKRPALGKTPPPRVTGAVIAKEYRRRGLYQSVLKSLRKAVAVPIESDDTMSGGAIEAWERVGAKPARRGRRDVMRLNPAGARAFRRPDGTKLLARFTHDVASRTVRFKVASVPERGVADYPAEGSAGLNSHGQMVLKLFGPYAGHSAAKEFGPEFAIMVTNEVSKVNRRAARK